RVYANNDLYILALEVMERWGYAFYDSLVIAAAIQADCGILYSEDLHDGHNILGLTIVNPFQG
ncbi:MAG: PIN domain-containing protein, partial [Chlorobiaceae bacterium]|nr:PIN domain-containing protein [Chlorobiaceae bacterium]